MGAGKTAVGRQLAHDLDLAFYDSDDYVETKTGTNIAWIFDVEGEQGFRRRETAAIDELTQLNPIILATGGGSVLSEQNRRFLRERGKIIYLAVSLSEQLQRTSHDSRHRRPLLQTSNRVESLTILYNQREPIYQSLADYKLFTDGCSVKNIVQRIRNYLQKSLSD